MKPSPDRQVLAALQDTVSTALREWLDDNRSNLLRTVREAVLESGAIKRERREQQVAQSEFLTLVELAQCWKFHPESVRRMIRQGRVPSIIVGRQNRVALTAIEAFEKDSRR